MLNSYQIGPAQTQILSHVYRKDSFQHVIGQLSVPVLTSVNNMNVSPKRHCGMTICGSNGCQKSTNLYILRACADHKYNRRTVRAFIAVACLVTRCEDQYNLNCKNNSIQCYRVIHEPQISGFTIKLRFTLPHVFVCFYVSSLPKERIYLSLAYRKRENTGN